MFQRSQVGRYWVWVQYLVYSFQSPWEAGLHERKGFTSRPSVDGYTYICKCDLRTNTHSPRVNAAGIKFGQICIAFVRRPSPFQCTATAIEKVQLQEIWVLQIRFYVPKVGWILLIVDNFHGTNLYWKMSETCPLTTYVPPNIRWHKASKLITIINCAMQAVDNPQYNCRLALAC